MPWITPKTDWKATYNGAGIYEADFFNVEDYNRIKNNLVYLKNLAKELIGVIDFPIGADKHLPIDGSPDWDNDNFFADEINMIEDGLETIDNAIKVLNHGEKQTFYENGLFIGYSELNRIERAELDIYEHLTDSIKGKLRLSFRLGTRENTIRV